MTDTYPLTIIRNRGAFGLIRGLTLFANTPTGRVRLGKVASGEGIDVQVPRNATELFGKMDWCKSEVLKLAFVEPGSTVYANLRFTINPLRMFGLIAMPCRFEMRPR